MQEEGSCACHMPTKEIVSSFVVSPGFSYDMCKYDYSGHAQAGLHIKAFLAWACVRDEKPATTRGTYEPRLLCVCVCRKLRVIMSNEQASERAPLPRLHEIKEDVEFVSPYTNIYVEIAV